MIPACDRHQRLVDQVASGEATDAELLSYADEVTACGACQQVLAVATRTHPAVIVQGGTESAEVGWQAVAPDAGMARLSEALQAADSGPRDGAMRWRVALGVGLAAAALAAVVLRTVDPAPPTAP